jgi:hypothetical protein
MSFLIPISSLQGFNVARENQWGNAAEKISPFFNSFQMADILQASEEYHWAHLPFWDSIGN